MEKKSCIQKYKELNITFELSDGELYYEGVNDVLTDEIIQQLINDKHQIIAELSEKNIESKNYNLKQREFCLSYNQQQLWFYYKMEPNSSLYNIPGGIHITGNINPKILLQAFNLLIIQYDSLRTRLFVNNGKAKQIIEEKLEVNIPIYDLSNLPEPSKSEKLKILLKEEAQIPFDLEKDVLFRSKLWVIDTNNSILQVTVHHIIADGWSMNILTKELLANYEAICLGYELTMSTEANNYMDYVENQKESFERGDLTKQINDLKEKFKITPPRLNLFTDMKRPTERKYTGNVECIEIEQELLERIKDVGKETNSSIFQIILAAFQVLLYRYSEQGEFIIGCLLANRDNNTFQTFGYLVNTIPLQLYTRGDMTFIELLKDTKAKLHEAMQYGTVPFIKLIENLKIERSIQKNPLFDILIAGEEYETIYSDQLDISFDYFLTDHEKSKFDLTLFVNNNNGTYSLLLEYDDKIYCRESINRILENFKVLLTNAIHINNVTIDSLNILSESERELVTNIWNRTERDYPLDIVLHQHIEKKVSLFEESIAVIDLSNIGTVNTMTYKMLNQKANKLAHYLHSLGVTTDTCVCIMMERSVEMVIGLLGILKAGAAYVPIDPDYPKQRIEYIIQDSEAIHILIMDNFKEKISQFPINKISLDADWGIISKYSDVNLNLPISPNNIAYMIYTSGSTGTPKGTMNTHRGICNRLIWMQEAFLMSTQDRVLQKTSYGFDVSVWEFFWPLMIGACLVLAKPGGQRDNNYIKKIIIEYKISILHFVPSMLTQFLDTEGVEECNPYLRYVICSGELLSYKLQTKFFEHMKADLYNLYGPTEAAVDVTWHRCSLHNQWGIVPIGKPITNTQIYILDKNQTPVPIGVLGELYIGGTNVSKGYWKKQDLTAEKFINNHITKNGGRKIYRTGDRARFLEDGNIQYIDRIDFQVKINGIRIELGEIENVLRSHFAIKDAVVNISEEDGIKKLVAFVIPENDSISELDLKDYLRGRLPSYMCPVYYIFIENFKLTINGKIDRSVLNKPIDYQPTLKNDYIEPTTINETILANIWTKVLKLDKVGIYDDYFDLGGDSIRSTQIVYECNQKGINLSVQHIFQYRTIAEISKVVSLVLEIDEQTDVPTPFCLVSEADKRKLPVDVEDAYPLSMIQAGIAYHSVQADYSAYITSFAISAQFDFEVFEAALQCVINEQAMLRTAFDFVNYSESLQLVYKNIKAYIELIDLRNMDERSQIQFLDDWIKAEKSSTFEWEKAHLFRFYLHRCSETTFRFTIVEPFLDGFSVSVLATSIFNYYKEFCNHGISVKYKILKSTYRDYVKKELEILKFTEAKVFWDNKLKNCEKTQLARWSFEDSDQKTHELIRKKADISLNMSTSIKELSRVLRIPVKSILLAAHIRVMQILSGQSDIVTGVLLNGRLEQKDGEKLVGLFLNTLPFRIIEKEESYYELIKRVYQEETEILPFRRYPLAQIQSTQNGVLFDTVFNYVHFYPYQEFKNEEFCINYVQATDQTYFPLTVQFATDWRNGKILLSLDYSANEFTENQITQIEQYFIHVLQNMIGDCEQIYVNNHQISNKDNELLSTWKNENKKDNNQWTFLNRFEQQVLLTSNLIAVVDSNKQLTYDQLNKKANIIARELKRHNIAEEQIVAILARRNVEFLMTILSVFKAGGAYLPLHPEWPLARIKEIIQQSKSKIIITAKEYLPLVNQAIASITNFDGIDILVLEELVLLDGESKNIGIDYSLSNLAYVIYTSGSTGKPKGAMVEQLGMINHINAKVEDLGLNNESVIAQNSSQCFDISVWQFLAGLLVGGRVEVIEDDLLLEPTEFVDFIAQRKVNILELVPSLMRVIIDSINLGIIPRRSLEQLSYLLVTGEAFPSDLCKEWFQIYSNIPVVNAYGPTECSDDVTHNIIDCWQENEYPIVPIGNPIQNTMISIVNHRLKEVPIGVSGELVVQGVCVGRGYLNDKEQTDKVFQFDSDLGLKLYRTGDLCRYLPDGKLEYFGRLDNQVKIRGFRIEIGEIEKNIRQHTGVKDVVVVALKTNYDQELASYIVMEDEVPFDFHSLRSYLSKNLPEYMIPTQLIELEYFPLNQNGKIDLKALPRYSGIHNEKKANYVAPRNSLEKSLCKVWQEVLGIEKLGIGDSFHDMGGHSIQAIRLVSKIKSEMNISITVKQLLQNPTILALVNALEYDSKSDINEGEISPKGTKQGELQYLSYQKNPLKEYLLQNNEQIDAVAIGYLPDNLLELGISYEKIKKHYMNDTPQLRKILVTPLGRIALLTLPVFVSEIYADDDKLLNYLMNCVEIANCLGARTMCLTGLLPSATEYGKSLVDRLIDKEIKPVISTGHATTVSAIVLCVQKVVELSERDLKQEKLGILGVGSIGLNTLKLILQVLPHPLEIFLCDVFGKEQHLQDIAKDLKSTYGFKGEIHTLLSGVNLPEQFYDATLMIGAVNVEDVIKVDKLHKGTIIIDDSAPHCFDVENAIHRLENSRDILFTEGGILKIHEPIHEIRYMPIDSEERKLYANMINYRSYDDEIMGCLYSSILTSKFSDIKPNIGQMETAVCYINYQKLKELGYSAAELCCKDYIIPKEIITSFVEVNKK